MACSHPGQFVLVPREHAEVLAALSTPARAAVLAGLARLTGSARLAYPASGVELCPHDGRTTPAAHLHFHVRALAEGA